MDEGRRTFLGKGLVALAGTAALVMAPKIIHAATFLGGADKDNKIGKHENPEDYLIQEVPIGPDWYITNQLEEPLGTDDFSPFIIAPKESTSNIFPGLSNDGNRVFFNTKYFPVRIPNQGVVLDNTALGSPEIEVQSDGMGRFEANDPRSRIARSHLRKIGEKFYWCARMYGENRSTPRSLGVRIIPANLAIVSESNYTRKISITGPTYRPRAFSEREIKEIRAQIAQTGTVSLPTYKPGFF